MLKCLIVDDDLLSRKLLQQLIEKEEELQLVKQCEDVKSALSYLSVNDPDIMFLDIEMPEIDGFELLKQYSNVPNVIIVSSKETHAFEAFEYNVADYLRKPITYPRFQQAIQKVKDKIKKSNKFNNYIYIKDKGLLIKIILKEILYIKSTGDYLFVETINKNYVTHSTLKRIEQLLPNKFFQVSRSYIINLDKIDNILDNYVQIGKHNIPVSRSKKSELMMKINLL